MKRISFPDTLEGSKGFELKFQETVSEHAKEYGIEAKKPLYVANLCVSENETLKGIGKKVLIYLEEYALKNGNDIIFGHIAENVDMIKNWLQENGYAINSENNDFHKFIIPKTKVKYIDPPSGWRYGFPKPIPEDVKNVTEWLVQNGYPQKEIDILGEVFFCRYWYEEKKEN